MSYNSPPMRINRVLIVYKKSSYEAHLLQRDPVYLRLLRRRSVATRASLDIHREHQLTLRTIKHDLQDLEIPFDVKQRYRLEPIRDYDLVITVGGDGTFLETSHFIEKSVLIGVNSAPSASVGFYCAATRRNFRRKIRSLLTGTARIRKLARLELILGVEPPQGEKRLFPLVLNDILFTSRNPAGTTRYLLKIGNRREEQKSSGIWISPAAGSTAAIRSAGGRILQLDSNRFQYVVREPYQPRGRKYRLHKGVLSKRETVRILSMMDGGAAYLDGPHHLIPIKRGSLLTVRRSRCPVSVVW